MLKMENISVSYGDIQALWDISFTVEEGEIVTLVGSNGAGKTTTIKTIAGILNPFSGKIIFQGHQINHYPTYEIVEMGISQIAEGRKLFSGMTVLENLEMGAYSPKARGKRAETLRWIYQLFPL